MPTAPAIPEGLLLQFLRVDAEGEEAGYRIYADGRYETRAAGKPWVQGNPLNVDQLEDARAALADAALDTLPAVSELPGVRHDGRVLWVQAVLEGAEQSVALVGPASQPAIHALSARLVALFAER